MEKEIIKLSVRNFVEFIYRSGNIDNRRGKMKEKDAMQEGSRIHRKIQKSMSIDYKSEIPLHYLYETEEYTLVMEGRADGIFPREDIYFIDEIKGVYKELAYLEEPVFLHLAQARCYGYMLALEKNLDYEKKVGIQITYCNIETEEIKRFEEILDLKSLEDWFLEGMKEYKKWADFQVSWNKKRKASLQRLEFPFPYRTGQKQLAAMTYTSVKNQENLFIQAPTGVGKTLSVVFPSMKAMGEGYGDKIFYLTAKTSTARAANEAYEILDQQEIDFKVLTITAKEKMCLLDDMECTPDACPYAKGHFDRVNEGIYHFIQEVAHMTREKIAEFAKNYQLCPYEFCLDVSYWADMVICDYNYAFDPTVSLRRFFSEGVKGDYIFLIDEAHNLVERGRSMYTASLIKERVLELKKAVKGQHKKLERELTKSNQLLIELKRDLIELEERYIYYKKEEIENLFFSLLRISGLIEELLGTGQEWEDPESSTKILEFYFSIMHFLNIYEEVDDKYRIYGELEDKGEFNLNLFCIDPSVKLNKVMEKGRSAIFFSATFLPIQYYKSLLTVEEKQNAIYIDSPFDTKNRQLLISKDISSRYSRRSYQEYEKIVLYIEAVIQAKMGNYMVFFPSYAMMKEVYNIFEERKNPWEDDHYEIILQESSMTERKRKEFLDCFQREEQECEPFQKEKSLLGFCVLGGIFGEGIDLKEEALIGSIIVGTGIPQICTEREILKEYFDETIGSGFEYAYRYPGMNKVLQSAGRVIRTERDKGVILLLDYRFLERENLSLFPKEWSDFQVCTLDDTKEILTDFWFHLYE